MKRKAFQKPRKWQLRYADGSKFSDLDGEPHESPPFGVIAVVQPAFIPGTDWCIAGAEVLLWREDLQVWMRTDDKFGLLDQLAHFAHLITCVRPGRSMPGRDYKDEWGPIRKEWGIK